MCIRESFKEEQIHGDFGNDVNNIIKKENPDWFDDDYNKMIQDICQEAFISESKITDWIFKEVDLDSLQKNGITACLLYTSDAPNDLPRVYFVCVDTTTKQQSK